MDLEAKILRSMKEDLVDPSDFHRFFTFDHSLGEGSDGQVSAVLHRSSKRLIAVRIPHTDRISTSIIIENEAKTLKTLSNFGKHMNINHMIAYQSKHGVNLLTAALYMFVVLVYLLNWIGTIRGIFTGELIWAKSELQREEGMMKKAEDMEKPRDVEEV